MKFEKQDDGSYTIYFSQTVIGTIKCGLFYPSVSRPFGANRLRQIADFLDRLDRIE